METYDVVIIGGGAAGLMCALTAGHRGRRVLVLEGSNKVGKKILMSGGGRCNFTNLYCSPDDFISANPSFCISALRRYTPHDFVALVEKHRIAYHEKAEGQLFCDNSSKDILALLMQECAAAGAEIETHCEEISVAYEGRYSIAVGSRRITCESLIVATGGLSIPKMGASDCGYRLARQFGINVRETDAGLVPYVLTGPLQQLTSRVSGISLPVDLNIEGKSFGGDMLFTHRGLSGPSVLQSSNFWKPGTDVQINLLPGVDIFDVLANARQSQPNALIRTTLSDYLPRALVLELQSLWWSEIAETTLASLSDQRLGDLSARLHAWRVRPSGTEGYRTAEVTRGGVDTDALSSKTMECRNQPGLFFIGEVVDVTGKLGGFNFQWAWASAVAAGQVV